MDLSFLSNNVFTDRITQGITDIAPRIPEAIFVFLIGFVIIKIISWISGGLLRLVKMPRGLHGIIHSLVNTLLWLFLIISILQVLGLTGLALIFSGSIAALGLALGAGASSLASDILAGIFLAQDRDFSIGDLVRLGDGPTEGIVESMDMRRTRVRDKEDKLHIIPNSVIERKEWVILTKRKDLSKS
jgi:small-conductance mechanosensitive channel